jgi:DNA (cytosine-5)-methyltransferase 1
MTIKKPTAVALFAGAGGLSLGFKYAGFHIAVATDLDKAVEITYSQNNPETIFVRRDIRKTSAEELLAPAGLKRDSIDIVIGGPPCQGFSLANQQSRFLDNPNNRLFKDFIRIVEEIRPRWFLMENVVGLLRMKKGLIRDEIVEAFERLGYKTAVQVLRAVDYGVPQIRERIFFVGNCEGKNFIFPQPTHFELNPYQAAVSPEKAYVTVKQAIWDLPSLGSSFGCDEMDYDPSKTPKPGTYAYRMRNGSKKLFNHRATRNSPEVQQRYKYIKQGENWSSIPEHLMRSWRSIPPEEIAKVSHSSLYKRLAEDEPSITVANFRKSMFIHPWEDRGLTVREAARLQSFPDTYRFFGSLGAQQQQVANAVPPLLAQAVAEQIFKFMAGTAQSQESSIIQLKPVQANSRLELPREAVK